MALVRFYPNRLNEVSKELDRAFNHFFADWNLQDDTKSNITWNPKVDITETGDEFILTAELAGVNKDDVDIRFENDQLKISGERKRENTEDGPNYLREERFHGKFSRVFNVNTKVDSNKIEAAFKDGLLTIRLPKAEEVKPKEIKIKVGK